MELDRIEFADIETVNRFVFLRAGKLYHCRRAASTFLMGYSGEITTAVIRAAEATATRWNKRYSRKVVNKTLLINTHSYRREDLAWVLLTDSAPLGVVVLENAAYPSLRLDYLKVISAEEFAKQEQSARGSKAIEREKHHKRYIARVRLKQTRNAQMRLDDGTYPTWYDPTIVKENATTNCDRKRK